MVKFCFKNQPFRTMSTPSLDLSDQLECPVCMDQLWEPKLLNCAHTFCLKCLQGIFDPAEFPQNPVVTCPVCRKKTPVPNKGVAGLNSNFALQSLLEALEPLKPKTTVEVPKTAEGEATACQIHNEIRKFYCCTCEVLICRDCTVVDHPRPEHKCMNLDEAYTWRRELNDKELKEALKVVKLTKKCKGILQASEATLNQRCDQVVAEIEKCREMGLEQLQRKTEAVEAFQVDLEAEILGLHDLTEGATKMDLLDASCGLIESLKSLREQQSELLDKPEAVQYPVFVGSSEEIQGWPKQFQGKPQGKPDKPKPSRQLSSDSKEQAQEDTGLLSMPTDYRLRTSVITDYRLPIQTSVPQMGDNSRGNRGRGYHYHHRGRGGQDNRGRGGSASDRGREGYQHRGRGGKRGQSGGERGRGSGGKKENR